MSTRRLAGRPARIVRPAALSAVLPAAAPVPVQHEALAEALALNAALIEDLEEAKRLLTIAFDECRRLEQRIAHLLAEAECRPVGGPSLATARIAQKIWVVLLHTIHPDNIRPGEKCRTWAARVFVTMKAEIEEIKRAGC